MQSIAKILIVLFITFLSFEKLKAQISTDEIEKWHQKMSLIFSKQSKEKIDSCFTAIESQFTTETLNENVYYLSAKAELKRRFENDENATMALSLKAMNLYEQQNLDDWDLLGKLYKLTGATYLRAEKYEKTKEIFTKAIALFTKHKDTLNLAIAYTQLGKAENRLENYDVAISKIKKAINLLLDINHKRYLPILYTSLQRAYSKKARIENNRIYVDSSIYALKTMMQHIDEPSNEVSFTYHNNLASLYKRSENYQQAHLYLDSAELFINTQNQEDLRFIFRNRLDIYEVQKNYELLAETARNYYDVVDSVYSSKISNELDELKISLEQECLLREEVQNEELATQKAQSRLYITLLSAFLLGIGGFFYYIFQKRKKEKELSELKQKLLSSQMNPHFTFNTLANIKALILQEENQKASKYLTKFSHLLRKSMNSSLNETVLLDDEIELLENYLALQKIRFNNEFSYKIQNDVEMSEDYLIPSMLLQPFVENCFKHAFKNIDYKGEILVHIFEKNNKLICQIADNGIGLINSKPINTNRKSLTFDITKRRFALQEKSFTTKGKVSIKPNPKAKSGCLVNLEIPYNFH